MKNPFKIFFITVFGLLTSNFCVAVSDSEKTLDLNGAAELFKELPGYQKQIIVQKVRSEFELFNMAYFASLDFKGRLDNKTSFALISNPDKSKIAFFFRHQNNIAFEIFNKETKEGKFISTGLLDKEAELTIDDSVPDFIKVVDLKIKTISKLFHFNIFFGYHAASGTLATSDLKSRENKTVYKVYLDRIDLFAKLFFRHDPVYLVPMTAVEIKGKGIYQEYLKSRTEASEDSTSEVKKSEERLRITSDLLANKIQIKLYGEVLKGIKIRFSGIENELIMSLNTERDNFTVCKAYLTGNSAAIYLFPSDVSFKIKGDCRITTKNNQVKKTNSIEIDFGKLKTDIVFKYAEVRSSSIRFGGTLKIFGTRYPLPGEL